MMTVTRLFISFYFVVDFLLQNQCSAFVAQNKRQSCFRQWRTISYYGSDADEVLPVETKINGSSSSRSSSSSDTDKAKLLLAEDFFGPPSSTIEYLNFVLPEHKPLGCTADESLATESDDTTNFVFVSKVTAGGNAEKAGIKVGDVIIGVTEVVSGEILNVVGGGLIRVRELVGGLGESDPLTLQVVRGTDVMSRHETEVVNLCILSDEADEMVESCLNSFWESSVDLDAEDEQYICDSDDDAECMLDAMVDIWSEELPEAPKKEEPKDEGEKKKEVMPWARRSSPSGTFVRDPTTGEMKNVDA